MQCRARATIYVTEPPDHVGLPVFTTMESTVDLNDLFHRHQVAMMWSVAARTPESRLIHELEARGFAACIADEQSRLGVPSWPGRRAVSAGGDVA